MATNTDPPLYCRQDSEERGRHLVACRNIAKGRLIFAERPLLALQSLENLQHSWVCHCCKAFVGGPDAALDRRFRAAAAEPPTADNDDNNNDSKDGRPVPIVDTSLTHVKLCDEDEPYRVVPCRERCGHVYCSDECEQDAWRQHHKILCTGKCTNEHHPLVQFKHLAVRSNEILLLVAEWWVAEHLWDKQMQRASPAEQNEMNPYRDWIMEPWWDVVTLDMEKNDEEASALQTSLKELCNDAAELLCQVFAETESIPPISALDIARRVGACEQNAMGIRQRHPVCRDVFDREFRERRHQDIIRCLEEAGFVGEDEESNGLEEDLREDTCTANEQVWDYSVDEVAEFLSNLFMDETGSVRDTADPSARQRDSSGDDLDCIFPPFDGTAMFATACKMNHSCDPNIVLLYKTSRWGRRRPLAAFAVARKHIRKGDELTISYIHSDQLLSQRQSALANYGFKCLCGRCEHERSNYGVQGNVVPPSNDERINDDVELFGEDSDSESNETELKSQVEDGEERLQGRLERLNSATNYNTFGAIPKEQLGSITSFVLQTSSECFGKDCNPLVSRLVKQCVEGLQHRDFSLIGVVSSELESELYGMLQEKGSWPNMSFREAYWVASVCYCLAFCHECEFINGLAVLDKGLVLGLPYNDSRIRRFFGYVEKHGNEMHTVVGKVFESGSLVDNFQSAESMDLLNQCLSHPIRNHVPETIIYQHHLLSFDNSPIFVRHFAKDWPAIERWRNVSFLSRLHGHRLVPIEIGSMMKGEKQCEEKLVSLRCFVTQYLSYPEKTYWTLEDATNHMSNVSYLAQHPLAHQIPSLFADIKNKPIQSDTRDPTQVNLWIGTGGTRTPLHFDTYDNVFVQLVGAKYVRLYDYDESLLDSGAASGFGLQGNISSLDCEVDDESPPFLECLLLPGDCLFIPSRRLHYVRSLTTSISVNYWF